MLDEKWTLERILGSGGMGAVYAARHRNGARAAVKVLHPELARRSDVRERFLREGYAANRVEHRGAVQVLDDDIVKEGPDEGTAYLVMEILEGESLEERIERGPPLTEPELLPILNDVLAVLEAAHEHGVIHRDLKPANLFLNKDPAGPGVKVLDFGLARLEEARSVTGVGLALGTPSFMAPEQANGRTAEIDARTDIFAVGATAFMILANRGVHEADGILELVARMGTLPAPKLRSVAPHVSEVLANIVDRALEFQRDDRYASASAMRADVQAALDKLVPPVLDSGPPPVSRRPDSARAAGAMSAVGAGGEAPEVRAARSPRRRRSFAPVVLALFVLAGLVLVFVPQARERAGVPNALGDLLSRPVDGAAGSDDAAITLGAGAVAVGSSSSTAAISPVFPAEAGSDLEDAAAAELAATSAVLDASADAGDAGSDDDDDDDDDVDASDVAAVTGRDASAPMAAGSHPGVVKHPASKPKPQKRVRPPGKRHRKPRR